MFIANSAFFQLYHGEHANHYTTDVVIFGKQNTPDVILIKICTSFRKRKKNSFASNDTNLRKRKVPEDFFFTKIYTYTLHIQSMKCQSQELHRWYNGSGARLEPAIDRGFETRSGQTKDYEIGICCFSAKHAA